MPGISCYWTIVLFPDLVPQDLLTLQTITQNCPVAVFEHNPKRYSKHVHLFISLPRAQSAEWLAKLAQVDPRWFICVEKPDAYIKYLKKEGLMHGSYNPS